MIYVHSGWTLVSFCESIDRQQRVHACLPHAVSAELRIPLEHEIAGRGHDVSRRVPLRSFAFDALSPGSDQTPLLSLTGLIVSDLGMAMSLWASQLPLIISKLERYQERSFPGGLRYYKLHGYDRCVVLSPPQRETLLAALRREDAVRRSAAGE